MKLWHSEMTMKLFEGDRLGAIKLIEPHIPKHLFKYMGATKYSFENFYDDKFFMSYPSQYNDPYDSLFSLIVDEVEDGNLDRIYHADVHSGEGNILDYIIRENELREEGARWRDTIKCCSFSEVNDSILMWSHYADNHKGICIEYDFKNVSNRSSENELYPIRYEQRIVKVDLSDDFDNIYVPLIASIVKSDSWKYEKEWRIVILSDQGFSDEEGNTFVKSPKPAAIYLGANVSLSDRNRYLDLAIQKGINAYSVRINPRKFRLEMLPEFVFP
jgi:Protein of unknown function (DUF2971)